MVVDEEVARQEEDRQRLKTLVDNAPTDKAPLQDILKCYDYDTEGSEISEALHKFYRKDLLITADYLKVPSQTYRYKDDLVKTIIKRIDNLLLEKCRKCKTWFSVGKDDTPTISCSSCGQGCHDSCYQNLGKILEEYPGLSYTCSRCDQVEQPDRPKKRESVEPKTNTPINTSSSLNQSIHHQDEDEENEEESLPICQKLRRGKCPHGISGRTLVDGRRCEFRHLKRCQYYCKHGTDPREGCDRGRDCNLLHPILCRFSVKSRLCTNLQCKFTHLTGTKRYRPRNQVHDYGRQNEDNYQFNHQDRPNQNNYQSQVGNSSRALGRNEPPQLANSFQNQAQNKPNQDSFLEQLFQQMQDMQREFREVKELVKPRSTTWQQPLLPPQTVAPQYQAVNQTRPVLVPQTMQMQQIQQPQMITNQG